MTLSYTTSCAPRKLRLANFVRHRFLQTNYFTVSEKRNEENEGRKLGTIFRDLSALYISIAIIPRPLKRNLKNRLQLVLSYTV